MSLLDKMMQIVAAATIWMNYAASCLKEDKLFFKQKNKRILNSLVYENSDWIKNDDKIKALLFEAPEIKKAMEDRYFYLMKEVISYDEETVRDNITISQDLFSLFMLIFLSSDNNQLVDFYILLEQYNSKNRIYYEKEVEFHLKNFGDSLVNYKVNPEVVQDYLTKIKNVKQ